MQQKQREIEAILKFIQSSWKELGEKRQPSKVWITLHAPLQAEADGIDTIVQSAWFLDGNGVHARPVDEYSRFAAVHMDRPWSGESQWYVNSGNWGRPHQIAVSRIAAYQDSDLWFVEWMWGNLDGLGMQVNVADRQVKVLSHLWKS